MTVPFLRWAGGKRQLLPFLHAAFSTVSSDSSGRYFSGRYFEPFLGGGALFFSLSEGAHSSVGRIESAFLGDMNQDLINCYEVVKGKVEELILALDSLAGDDSESAYYEVRSREPSDPVERAARLIYLNRLCFNGLYRLNSAGKFNVPYGRLKRPKVSNPELLRNCSRALTTASLINVDFSELLATVEKGDFVYLDPPYAPLSESSSFSSYHNSPFGKNEHLRLAEEIRRLTDIGAHVVLSNSDTRFTREVFDQMNRHSIVARRNIGAAASSRSPVREILGANFPVEFGHLNSLVTGI